MNRDIAKPDCVSCLQHAPEGHIMARAKVGQHLTKQKHNSLLIEGMK
jgi:hypothetical protein